METKRDLPIPSANNRYNGRHNRRYNQGEPCSLRASTPTPQCLPASQVASPSRSYEFDRHSGARGFLPTLLVSLSFRIVSKPKSLLSGLPSLSYCQHCSVLGHSHSRIQDDLNMAHPRYWPDQRRQSPPPPQDDRWYRLPETDTISTDTLR